MKHDIKCWPQYFCRVADGSKTFEVRVNDRGYQPGDTVLMREWNPEDIIGRGYTGKAINFTIGYVLPIDDNRVIFSLLPASPKATP